MSFDLIAIPPMAVSNKTIGAIIKGLAINSGKLNVKAKTLSAIVSNNLPYSLVAFHFLANLPSKASVSPNITEMIVTVVKLPKMAMGTITKGEGKTTLKSDEIILTEPEGKEVYYYVVFEYPNLDDNQNGDIGSTIKGNITIEEGNKYKQPELFITAATISGSNGWYKSASLTTSITTQTENYDVKYCITTENSCTPNTDATINNNQFNITLNNNAKEQRMCIKVVDEYEQVKGGCSEGYKVDNGVPTSNVMLASSSAGSNGWYKALTLKITGSDSHSGIYQYAYSKKVYLTTPQTLFMALKTIEVSWVYIQSDEKVMKAYCKKLGIYKIKKINPQQMQFSMNKDYSSKVDGVRLFSIAMNYKNIIA